MAAQYQFNIPSVQNRNPALPAVLGQVDLNRAIAAGDAIDRDNLIHAKAVATALKGVHGKFTYFCLNMLSCTQTLGKMP